LKFDAPIARTFPASKRAQGGSTLWMLALPFAFYISKNQLASQVRRAGPG
jgi:hypothetical protein